MMQEIIWGRIELGKYVTTKTAIGKRRHVCEECLDKTANSGLVAWQYTCMFLWL
jgi:hypothetical protein